MEPILMPDGGSRRKQIANYFREAILRGRIAPGEQLPGMRQLAAKLNVGVGSVQWAMNQLSNEGLITRCSGYGTVVNHRKTGLECIGVFFYSDGVVGANPFGRLLIEAINHECRARGFKMRLYHEDLRDRSVAAIRDGYEKQEFQVAIILGMHALIEPAVEKLTLPYVILDKTSSFRFESSALNAVEENGGKKFAFLYTLYPIHWEKARKFLEREAARRGLDFQPERDAYCPDEEIPPGDTERFQQVGYELTCRVGSDPANRPDSLVVYPDDMVPGVLMAILALGIRVPQQLKLFLHRNAERRMLCPVECVFIENRVADFAKILVDDCVAKLDGRPPTHAKIPYVSYHHRFELPSSG